MEDRVCAIIVTYHPENNLEKHLSVLRQQVGGLVVVDNRSNDSELAMLRVLAQRHSFTLIENPDNYGIGTALNQGIRCAASQGRFRYVALFDQDSEAGQGFVDRLVSCLECYPGRGKVAVAAPRIYSRNTDAFDAPFGAGGRSPVAQTSGSLMPLEVFDAQGWFKEELFIDYVDYEYCLRVGTAGWVVLRCDEAILSHSPGDSRRHTFLGRYICTSGNYSPLRHYYSTRNGVWLIGRYWRKYPKWCARQVFRILKEEIKVGLLETGSGEKLKLSLCGLADALKGELGKRSMAEREAEKQ